MVKEAEEFAKEDLEIKEKIESKNELEALVYQSRSTLDNEEMKSKLSDEDITKVETALNGADNWLMDDEHSKADYENKKNELNGILQPIMMKVYQQGTEGSDNQEAVPPGTAPGTAGMPGVGPTIDEVD